MPQDSEESFSVATMGSKYRESKAMLFQHELCRRVHIPALSVMCWIIFNRNHLQLALHELITKWNFKTAWGKSQLLCFGTGWSVMGNWHNLNFLSCPAEPLCWGQLPLRAKGITYHCDVIVSCTSCPHRLHIDRNQTRPSRRILTCELLQRAGLLNTSSSGLWTWTKSWLSYKIFGSFPDLQTLYCSILKVLLTCNTTRMNLFCGFTTSYFQSRLRSIEEPAQKKSRHWKSTT